METIEKIIAGHAFWQGIAPEFVPLLARCARRERYGVGDLVFQERQEASHLYLLHTGQVALETFVPGAGVTTLQVLNAGEALGWSWLFPPHRWQYTARSLDATEIVAFGAADLRAQAEANPAFGKDLVSRMAQILLQRLHATRVKLCEFRFPGAAAAADDGPGPS